MSSLKKYKKLNAKKLNNLQKRLPKKFAECENIHNKKPIEKYAGIILMKKFSGAKTSQLG